MRILVIDVGGNNVKIRQPEQHTVVKIPSGPALTAARMVKAVMRATADWKYDAVSIGYPGPVANGRPAREPHNLGRGWTRYDYRAAFHKPVRLLNDAAMQALGSYHGGRMLYLGLGTGLGSMASCSRWSSLTFRIEKAARSRTTSASAGTNDWGSAPGSAT